MSSTHHYTGSGNIGSRFFPPLCSHSIPTALVPNLCDYNLSTLQCVFTQMPSSKSERLISVQFSCLKSQCLQDQVHIPWLHMSPFPICPHLPFQTFSMCFCVIFSKTIKSICFRNVLHS